VRPSAVCDMVQGWVAEFMVSTAVGRCTDFDRAAFSTPRARTLVLLMHELLPRTHRAPCTKKSWNTSLFNRYCRFTAFSSFSSV
jgi:hypothetical protein